MLIINWAIHNIRCEHVSMVRVLLVSERLSLNGQVSTMSSFICVKYGRVAYVFLQIPIKISLKMRGKKIKNVLILVGHNLLFLHNGLFDRAIAVLIIDFMAYFSCFFLYTRLILVLICLHKLYQNHESYVIVMHRKPFKTGNYKQFNKWVSNFETHTA